MKKLETVTAFLYVTTQIAALAWVTVSYAIALYSTVKLQTPFPVETLSGQAIGVILGVTVAKTVGNIFEHNDGAVFGTSDTKNSAPAGGRRDANRGSSAPAGAEARNQETEDI